MVSIIIAMIMMVIMSLIVLAMSQNAQREQRQSLDRQLSDQAFYNAETGINDAIAYLAANPGADTRKPNCNTVPGLNGVIDRGVNTYSCLQYDKAPKTVVYNNLSTSTPKVIPIQTVDESGNPVEVKDITIHWEDSDDPKGAISGKCSFTNGSPDLPRSCGYGGVRFELVGVFNNPGITDDRDELNKNTLVSYFLPTSNAGIAQNIDIGPTGDGYKYRDPNTMGILKASNCSNVNATPKRCSNVVKNVNRSNVYLAIRSLYRETNVIISGEYESGGTRLPVRFNDAQIMIDSTGKANDVLRRVQVRVPSNSSQVKYPGFGLQTKDSICKLIEVTKKEGSQPEAKQTAGGSDAQECSLQ